MDITLKQVKIGVQNDLSATTFLMSSLFYMWVCAVRLNRGIRTVGAKNLKKISKKCGIVNSGRPLFRPTRSGARHPKPVHQNHHRILYNLALSSCRPRAASFASKKK